MKTVIELGREAGYYFYDLTETHGVKTVETDEADTWAQLERFAELVRADERAQRKPLTYAELMALAKNSGLGPENVSGLLQARLEIYGRAIEAAHGIKEKT